MNRRSFFVSLPAAWAAMKAWRTPKVVEPPRREFVGFSQGVSLPATTATITTSTNVATGTTVWYPHTGNTGASWSYTLREF